MADYVSTNPVTAEVTATFPEISDQDVETMVAQSTTAQKDWAATEPAERARLLRAVAQQYRDRSEELAMIITTEMGKPMTQSRGEVNLVASIYDYYADHLDEFLAPKPLTIAGDGSAEVQAEPIGPLLGVMPWNFPYYQIARFAAPNMALGNTVMVKHARNCPRSALVIEEIMLTAGVPEGVYTNAFISTGQVETIIGDQRVAGVSLTGSERAGEAIGAAAGKYLKRSVLELGGSDPFVVLADADVDAAAKTAASGRIYNSGQACSGSKRFLVHADIYDEFVEKFTAEMADYVPTDPTQDDSLIGPLSSAGAATELDEYIEDAVAHGAEVKLGGREAGDESAFFPTTVLTDVPRAARAYYEELFGPVAVVHSASSDEELVELANDSVYGLGGSVFSNDRAHARKIANQIETGMIAINGVVRSAPDLPFGGIKRSGIGLELSEDGFLAFANQKLIREP